MPITQWNESESTVYAPTPGDAFNFTSTQLGPKVTVDSVQMITNADTGAAISWHWYQSGYCALSTDSGCTSYVGTSEEYHLTTMAGGAVASDVVWNPVVPRQYAAVQPVLQLADGSFVGTVRGQSGNVTVAFDSSGNVKWTGPGYNLDMATADGGIITDDGTSYITLDANGNITGHLPTTSLYTYSWLGNAYQSAPVQQVAFEPIGLATPPYWSLAGANQSGNGTSPLCHDDRDKLVAEYGNQVVPDSSYPTPYPRFTPGCFLFSNSAHSQYFTFVEINTPSPSLGTPEFGFALVKNPLVVPTGSGYGLDLWRQIFNSPRIINSGYRDPVQNNQAGGVANSRHMLGDAVDLRNESGTQSEWNAMFSDAGDSAAKTGAQADFRESQDGPCGLGCVHADWRYHDRTKYSH